MKSFSVIKANVGSYVQDTSSAFSTIVGLWVNNRYRDIINSYDWEQLYHNQSLTTTANTSAYAFDENTERLIYAVDITNDCPINIVTEQDFLQNYGDALTDTGSPDTCFLVSDVAASQPETGQKLIIKSSSASDTTQTILLRGLSSTAGEVYESLTCNGTTAVTASNIPKFLDFPNLHQRLERLPYMTMMEVRLGRLCLLKLLLADIKYLIFIQFPAVR